MPKYIEVSGAGIQMQLEGRSEMEMDLFDAAIRRFKELDERLYGGKECQRWRHFVESDFMVCMQVFLSIMCFISDLCMKFLYYLSWLQGSILAGKFDTDDPAIRCQFIGPNVSYDVVNCRMVSHCVKYYCCVLCFMKL